MTVAQVQSQYETAAAQIPQIESQIAQTENALSVLLGRNPGPIPRGKSIYDLALPDGARGRAVRSCSSAGPTSCRPSRTLIAANAQIGAAKALYFPTISLTGALGSASTRPVEPVQGPDPDLELRRSARRADLHLRRGQRPGRAGRGRAAGGAARATSCRSRTRSPTSTTRWSPTRSCSEQLAAQERLVAALQGLRAPRAAAVRRRLRAVLDGAAGRADAVPGRARRSPPCARRSFASAVNIYKAMGGGWVDGGGQAHRIGASRPRELAEPPPLF